MTSNYVILVPQSLPAIAHVPCLGKKSAACQKALPALDSCSTSLLCICQSKVSIHELSETNLPQREN